MEAREPLSCGSEKSAAELAITTVSCQNLSAHFLARAKKKMIARIWRGVTREADKDTYFEYLQETGLKEYASAPGNRGVWVLRRVFDGRAEFTLISHWESWDAIKAFAGADCEKAVYYPQDEKFLLEMLPKVEHYEILSSPFR
jgi:heme-degrading monooxygenase HmoA